MSTEIKQAVDSIHSAFAEFKATQKEVIAQEVKGALDPLLAEKFDRINDAITKAEDAKDAAEKAQAMAQARREVEQKADGLSAEQREIRSAFLKYVAQGENKLNEKETNLLITHTKALSSGSDTAGGYTVMPQFDTEITRVLNETSPVRRVATVKQVSSDQYEKLQRTDRAGAAWADRDAAPTETDTPTFKKLTIKAWKLAAEPQISQDLLDDSFINIEQELMNAVIEEFELTENTAFVSGDGVGQPRGFLSYDAGTSWGQIEQVASGNASALTYNGLIDLVYSLKDAYLARAAFMMKRSTVAAIRKLADSQGNPLWQPGFGSEPATLLGYPIVRANDMPAIASNALAIAFGDFSRGYTIIDRVGTRILRDPYTSKPFVKFYTTKRVGAAVDNFEAIKLQKISA